MIPQTLQQSVQVGDVTHAVVCSDRGGTTQIYYLKLLKPWREAMPVFLLSLESDRDELGLEIPNSTTPSLLLCDSHV